MVFDIQVDEAKEINFHPKSTVEEVSQNIRTILSTPIFSVPLNRGFGVTSNMLDEPLPLAKAKLTAEIFEVIQKYEPRVIVNSVTFTEDSSGVLRPKVGVTLIE